MISALLGRFFRHCIAMSALAESNARPIKVHEYDPSFMTDQEISDFLHNRCHLIDWDLVAQRRARGDRQEPWAAKEAAGISA